MLVPPPPLGKRRPQRLHSTAMRQVGKRARAATPGAVVGVISDTHGLLRPEAVAALAGVDVIFHAGDIGSAAVLEALRQIAPIIAVRGNNDRESWAASLPEIVKTDVGGIRLCVVHDIKHLGGDPASEGVDVVISGHSHRPSVERRARLLLLNPGSAGPRRFTLPVSGPRSSSSAPLAHPRGDEAGSSGRP